MTPKTSQATAVDPSPGGPAAERGKPLAPVGREPRTRFPSSRACEARAAESTPADVATPILTSAGPQSPGQAGWGSFASPGNGPGVTAAAQDAVVAPESGPRTWVLELPEGTSIVSGNNRLNRYARNDRIQALKQKTRVAVLRAKIPPLGRADIEVRYFSPPRLKRLRHPFASDAISDSDNISPTGKACADGIVLAGVFVSDAKKRVRRVISELDDATHPRGLVRITITEVVAGDPP